MGMQGRDYYLDKLDKQRGENSRPLDFGHGAYEEKHPRPRAKIEQTQPRINPRNRMP